MKANCFALTCDQLRSRTDIDRVPDALAALAGLDYRLAPERTSGDEIQALTSSADTVVAVVERLTRLGHWRVGAGIGTVELPLPSSTREARGPAYLAARDAVEAAQQSPRRLALRSDVPAICVAEAETCLWLYRGLLDSLSQGAWQVLEMFDNGLSNAQIAHQLGIATSAVSQRMTRTEYLEVRRARELCCARLEFARESLGSESKGVN